MTAWNEEFPENSVFDVCLDSHRIIEACKDIGAAIHMENKLPPENRRMTPGLRYALNVLRQADQDTR